MRSVISSVTSARAQSTSSSSRPSSNLPTPLRLPISPECGRTIATLLLTGTLVLGNVSASMAGEVDDLASKLRSINQEGGGAVYFGNGCFWGRQKDFIETEKRLGRPESQVSALVGYAGGVEPSRSGKVCYFSGPPDTHYDALGHAEVVSLRLDPNQEEAQVRAFARTYFNQFRKTPFGMIRSDPQDRGAGYRPVIGIPGGFDSPLLRAIQDENVNGMTLLKGEGNRVTDYGLATEDDVINTIWVLDSNKLPFYQAEKYHQMHNGIGKDFGKEYRVDLKRQLVAAGTIKDTGCPDY